MRYKIYIYIKSSQKKSEDVVYQLLIREMSALSIACTAQHGQNVSSTAFYNKVVLSDCKEKVQPTVRVISMKELATLFIITLHVVIVH